MIGLFLEEQIPRGMTLQETIAEIKRQGGLVYVPHPFDRMHAVPDYEHLLDGARRRRRDRGVQPARRDRPSTRRRRASPPSTGSSAGAGSDSHVAAGLGSVRIRMRDFDGPEEFLESLRDADIIRKPSSLLYVQALKFLETKATPCGARRAAHERAGPPGGAQVLMHRQGHRTGRQTGPMPATDDEIREKYLERAIRELNPSRAICRTATHCPRGTLMPVLGSGHPQADVFLLKFAPRPPEIEEGVAFYGRAGSALMKSLKRLRIDPLAVYGTLFVKCPVADPSLADAGVRGPRRRGDRDRPAARSSS